MAAADKLNGAYWRKRAIELAEKQKREDDDLCLRFHREYERILHELDKEISIFYARYAANESVSMADARKLLRDAELEDFRMSLDEFRGKAIAGGFDKELEEVYLRSRISRLQALQTQVELRMMELFGSQRDVLRDHLQERYMDTYYRTVYAVSQQMNVASTFARIDPQTVEKILAVPWFANDMEDVQEVIFVIKNYGGTDKTEFMSDLKKSKLIKVEGDGGVDTIRAEIPFEARNAFLERTRRQIFVSGMGVDPNPENFGNSSGVALKYLYSLLELKAVMLETQFRSGFAELVRAICRLEGIAQPKRILQTWTRNMVQNDLETAQIAQQSVGIISDRTILANHPWVDDAESEQKQLEKEQQAAAEKQPHFRFPPKDGAGDGSSG